MKNSKDKRFPFSIDDLFEHGLEAGMETKNGAIYVHKSVTGETDEYSEELIAVHKFITEPAMVAVSLGLTIGLPNYSSAKVNIFIRRSCYNEEIEDAYDWVLDRVEKKLNKIKKDVEGWRDEALENNDSN